MNYLRSQVNFRQLRAETAGNRYLRSFLPASAGIFTCESVYLRPSQVILHAPVLQCGLDENKHSVNYNFSLRFFYQLNFLNDVITVRFQTLWLVSGTTDSIFTDSIVIPHGVLLPPGGDVLPWTTETHGPQDPHQSSQHHPPSEPSGHQTFSALDRRRIFLISRILHSTQFTC